MNAECFKGGEGCPIFGVAKRSERRTRASGLFFRTFFKKTLRGNYMPISAIAGLASRRVLALVLLVAFVLGMSVPAFAGTTGVLNGTISAAKGVPVSGASLTVVSPSGTYHATTDSKGFFSIPGIQADTYTVTVTAAGYDAASITGVTVNADQTTPLTSSLTRATAVIGRTASRSQSSAFQPAATTDTYNLGASQIATQLGKKGSVSETNLLTSIPGASLDSSGYPVLRGGRENEEGFQFEGIDYTDAFSNQFVNSLALNNPGGFQLTPGAGDASSGNSGTGVINLLLKRGTYPAFGSAEADVTQGNTPTNSPASTGLRPPTAASRTTSRSRAKMRSPKSVHVARISSTSVDSLASFIRPAATLRT